MQIVDHMQDVIQRKNSRAVTEELKSLIRRLLKNPVPIETRLTRLPAMPVGKTKSFFPKNEYCFRQDITLEYNQKDHMRFIKFLIEDEE
mmetsp:Transcript_2851/g.3846  ORF Transcript_2851/g.3846 Transcript_2851/m.3846 type:complete len:89 (-) Transcript_2851:1176-1442(-)